MDASGQIAVRTLWILGTPQMTTLSPEPIAYSVADACRAISCGRTWLYARIKAGEIEVRRIHGRTLIPAASLRALIERAA